MRIIPYIGSPNKKTFSCSLNHKKMDFSSDDSSCSDFDEDPDTMEVPDIDISIASTMKNHNYLDGDTNNNPYSQIEAENVLDEVEEFSTPPITENNEHEIETEEETQPVIENTKNHTLPQRLPPTTSRNISVCINGRMIKLDTRNAVLVTPELLKSMGGLEGTNVNRSVINNVTRFNGSSARVNNNQPVTDRIPHQVLVNNNPNTTGSSSEQGVLVNSNGAIPRLDFRNGFQIRLPSQRSTGSSAHVNNTQPVTDQISHQVLVSNRITTESSTEQGVLVNTNGAIPRLDYRNGFRIEPASPRLTGQSIPGGRRILTIDGIIDTVDDDISDPPTLTQQPTQSTY
ncbi:uncharacterized protein LOC123321119 [Coccinella septempunctata]|uniref:uncharacterized protein LOC123321119 n=1 Tax=Coccinella septempunctata TaxID=41139 RepID=UPI001D088852|nr:uncharacterized protein LOC123321119 [Coccinella septempunctata]